MHEAADATVIGVKMIRHLELTNGAGLRCWGSRHASFERTTTEPYVAVFDEVVVQLHTARVQIGAVLGVAMDPQNPMDPDGHGIDWIRPRLPGPPPPGSTSGPGAPGARKEE